MKSLVLILLLMASRAFAADDPSLVAAGEWSQPAGDGNRIRGRLLICDTPRNGRTDTAVYLELQEISSAVRSPIRVYCEMNRMSFPDDHPGLRCELRDRDGKIVPEGGAFSGGGPLSSWVTLDPYCSVRIRASMYGGGRLKDGGLAIYLASRGCWDVHPNPTNDYYLSGTFTSIAPTNNPFGTSTNDDVWFGKLMLPRVKIPIKKP